MISSGNRRPTLIRRPTLLAAVLISLVVASCGDDPQQAAGDQGSSPQAGREDWPDSLVLSAVPSEESAELQERYQPVIGLLESELGLDVEFFQATDYAGVIEAMIAGKGPERSYLGAYRAVDLRVPHSKGPGSFFPAPYVDLAQFGPFSYVIAKANGANIDPVASAVDEEGDQPGYHSNGIVAPGSDIDSIEDFAGKNVCFVDPSSTSGFLFPSAGLLDAGIDPETGVEPVFAGGHDVSALSVANGDCEAGFADDTRVGQQLGAEPGSVEVVWESDLIPGSPLAVRLDLPESLIGEIRRIITEEANLDALEASGRCRGADCVILGEDTWGYAEVNDAFYEPVRQVCEATRAAACEGEG